MPLIPRSGLEDGGTAWHGSVLTVTGSLSHRLQQETVVKLTDHSEDLTDKDDMYVSVNPLLLSKYSHQRLFQGNGQTSGHTGLAVVEGTTRDRSDYLQNV